MMHEQREVPSPNAFDFYVEAGRMVNEALTRNDRYVRTYEFSDSELPEEVRETTASPQLVTYLDLDDRSPDEQRDIVARCSDGLRTFREGTRYPCMIPWETAASHQMFTLLAPIRSTAQVLRVESDMRASGGDFGNAMGSLLDVIRLGTDIPRGGLVSHMLVGVSVSAIGTTGAWKLIESLDGGEAKAAARRMEEILGRSCPLSETISDEKRYAGSQLARTLGNPFWKLAEATNVDPPEAELEGDGSQRIGWGSIFSRFIRLLPLSRKRVLGTFDSFMDEQIARAGMPYAQVNGMPELTPGMPYETLSDYSRGSWRVAAENALVQRRLLALSLALRACLQENGRYPGQLSELVPEYLSEVPADPFSDGAPLRYQVDGDRYVLYSVGPDGVDDGGAAIENPCSPDCCCAPPRKVALDSKGDIVAGVNW